MLVISLPLLLLPKLLGKLKGLGVVGLHLWVHLDLDGLEHGGYVRDRRPVRLRVLLDHLSKRLVHRHAHIAPVINLVNEGLSSGVLARLGLRGFLLRLFFVL